LGLLVRFFFSLTSATLSLASSGGLSLLDGELDALRMATI
jgi:hypothetical protein